MMLKSNIGTGKSIALYILDSKQSPIKKKEEINYTYTQQPDQDMVDTRREDSMKFAVQR